MIWPFTRDCTLTDSIGWTVPRASTTIGTSRPVTVAVTTGTALAAGVLLIASAGRCRAAKPAIPANRTAPRPSAILEPLFKL